MIWGFLLIYFACGYLGTSMIVGYFRWEYPELPEEPIERASYWLLTLLGPMNLTVAIIWVITHKCPITATDFSWVLGPKKMPTVPTSLGAIISSPGSGYTSPPAVNLVGRGGSSLGVQMYGPGSFPLPPGGMTSSVSGQSAMGSPIYGRVRDLRYGDEFGWRAWRWEMGRLHSPQIGTPWYGPELRVEHWDESDVVRGRQGIHAEFVPVEWEKHFSAYAANASQVIVKLGWGSPGEVKHVPYVGGHMVLLWMGTHWANQSGFVYKPDDQIAVPCNEDRVTIHGIVERFGKFALGTDGWRAEWVIIRKLLAPDTETGLALEKAYPEVEIIYPKEED